MVVYYVAKAGQCIVTCLSTDTKPTGMPDEWILMEGDTARRFRSAGGAWIQANAALWGDVQGTLSNQTDLQAALDAKSGTGHTHAASAIVSETVATARLGSGTANGSTFLRGDQTWAAPTASAADPLLRSVTPGSFTVPTAYYAILGSRMKWSAAERVTLQGTARMRVV